MIKLQNLVAAAEPKVVVSGIINGEVCLQA